MFDHHDHALEMAREDEFKSTGTVNTEAVFARAKKYAAFPCGEFLEKKSGEECATAEGTPRWRDKLTGAAY